MANDYFTSIFSLCGLFQKQISFNAETETNQVTSIDRKSVKAEQIVNMAESAGFSATYRRDCTDGSKSGFFVDAVEHDSIAQGFGLKKGDWLWSGNDSKFETVEDIKNFFNSLHHEGQSISLKIMRQSNTIDSTNDSSQFEIVVLSKTNDSHAVSVRNHTHVTSQLNKWFQHQYTERYYIRWILRKSYVWADGNTLTLKSRVLRRNKNKAIFKVHHFRENFYCTDSAIPVILEHERSGQWVSLTTSEIAMKPAQNLNNLTPENTCLFKLVRENVGMNFMFKSYHLKRAGQVYFLGFQREDRSATPVKGTQGHAQPETAIFTLFSAP